MITNIRHAVVALSFCSLTAGPLLAQDQKAVELQKAVAEIRKQVEAQKQVRARGLVAGKSSLLAPTPRGFSVVLVVGDLQAVGTIPDNVPEGAKKALADMKDFLPYRSYVLTDAAWIAGCCQVVGRLRGPDEQSYRVNLRSDSAPGGGVQMGVSLEEVPPGFTNGVPMKGQTIIDTGFGRVEIGETVVVGTSRLNGDKALILLVTPVANAAATK